MNALEKFLAMIGMSSERYTKLSEAEQTNLQTVSDQVEAANTARIEAEAALTSANELNNELSSQNSMQADDIVAYLSTIESHEATISAHEATIAAHVATISTHEQTIASLKTELDKVPGDTETKVVKPGAEQMPGEGKRKKRSWEQ